jgi:hypothetical protein
VQFVRTAQGAPSLYWVIFPGECSDGGYVRLLWDYAILDGRYLLEVAALAGHLFLPLPIGEWKPSPADWYEILGGRLGGRGRHAMIGQAEDLQPGHAQFRTALRVASPLLVPNLAELGQPRAGPKDIPESGVDDGRAGGREQVDEKDDSREID